MIGTTRMMSYAGGNPVNPVTYTAFGERVCSLPGGDCQGVPNHRYCYAGAWGYQAHDNFPFLHVGHRYYDPASGRFLQRDPIGVRGGLNVYPYARNAPTSSSAIRRWYHCSLVGSTAQFSCKLPSCLSDDPVPEGKKNVKRGLTRAGGR